MSLTQGAALKEAISDFYRSCESDGMSRDVVENMGKLSEILRSVAHELERLDRKIERKTDPQLYSDISV
jgi:hypothetical protein